MVKKGYRFINGKLLYRQLDTVDLQAERKGKNVPNSNKRRLKLASDYNETEFSGLFKK